VIGKQIANYGGDIIQFLGNSLVALWPRDPEDPAADSDTDIIRKGIQCGLDIKNES